MKEAENMQISSRQNGFVKKALLAVAGFCLSAVLVGGLAIRLSLGGYLGSDQCRKWLNGMASTLLHGEAEFLPLKANGLDSIYSDGLTVRQAGGGARLLDAEQLRADLRLSFFSRACEVSLLDITRLRVMLPPSGQARAGAGAPVSTDEKATAPTPMDMSRFSMGEVTVGDFGLTAPGSVEMSGVRLRATSQANGGGTWSVAAEGGLVKPSFGPEWRLKKAEGHMQGRQLSIISSTLTSGERGEASVKGAFGQGFGQGFGQAGGASHGAPNQWEAKFSGLPVTEQLPVDWRARLEGALAGELEGDTQGGLKGEVSLKDGVLTAMPVLDAVAKMTHTDAFRRISLHQATAKIVKRSAEGDGVWECNDLLIESKGLLRVEGALILRDGQLDGTLQVGVPAAVLQWVPGARENIFTSERLGYFWTPVRISGPSTHPQEDLSARLATVAMKASVESAAGSVKESAQGVLDAVAPLVPVETLRDLSKQLPGIPGLF